MPDLLSHALIAYVIGVGLAWRYGWLDGRYVSVVMAGAFVPDITKIGLVVPGDAVAVITDLPFEWMGIHTLGGAYLCVLIGVMLVAPDYRRRVFGLLAVGAASHLLADALLRNANGYSYPLLWPVTDYVPPSPGLYLSTDLWPAAFLGTVALGIWVLDRRYSLTHSR